MLSDHDAITPSDYVLSGINASLSLLKAASSVAPIPWLGIAVEAALTIVSLAEVSHILHPVSLALTSLFVQGIKDNERDAEALKTTVCTVMLVVIRGLGGKTGDDIPRDLKENVERLSTYV